MHGGGAGPHPPLRGPPGTSRPPTPPPDPISPPPHTHTTKGASQQWLYMQCHVIVKAICIGRHAMQRLVGTLRSTHPPPPLDRPGRRRSAAQPPSGPAPPGPGSSRAGARPGGCGPTCRACTRTHKQPAAAVSAVGQHRRQQQQQRQPGAAPHACHATDRPQLRREGDPPALPRPARPCGRPAGRPACSPPLPTHPPRGRPAAGCCWQCRSAAAASPRFPPPLPAGPGPSMPRLHMPHVW